MGSLNIFRALILALACSTCTALTTLTAAEDDSDCALYLSGPGRSTAYDYTLNLLKGNFAYEGQHTCITYDAVNQAYLEARNRIAVSHPKGEWKAEDFASVGELILDISINLARRYGLTYEEIEKGLPLIDTSRTLIRDVCPPVFSHVECRAGKYRRLDGLCNNLEHPTWGSTMAPFQRLIGPLFSDGINAPRIAHTGRDLPLSRVVSRTMHPDEGYHDHAGTVMVIAWGQFMDHDYTLTGTPLDPINRNDPEECCKRPQHLKHPYCNEIRIPDDDYFYRLWSVKCIDFVRAFPSPRPGCRLGSRVPFNTLTGALDGNTVYGVTDKFSRKLRTGYGGLLRMNPVFKEYGLKDLLPLKLDIPDEGCTRPNKNMYCFEGGEIRVNEQLVLTVMHTLMAREHNRVAKALAAVNPHWDDETLFQEARRIIIAEIQHITYNEFLPILLGKDVMDKFGLVLEKQGYWDGYDHTVNPDVIDAFASAAFRFGHSLLPTAIERWSKAHKFIASKRLSDLIRRPYDLYRAGVLDEYVMGLMNQVAQAMDDSITQEVTNHLFKKVGARFGMDLVSFNMQRGREFGIPGYMEFRKFCGLQGADTFQDLFGSMPNETVRKYETIFEHPVDVDLWSGGVSERPLPGSMLGPTFACVIATQFSYSRRGDRFWFELPNQPSSFTPEQLAELRKSRLSRVICDNTDIIDTVQLYPMVLPDHELNPRVPCRSGILPSMDFSKWAEPAPFHGPKPFVTEAYMTAKNNTENETQIHKAEEGIHLDNTTEEINITDKPSADIRLQNCQNINGQDCSDGANCTKCADIKAKETQGPNTVLKYGSKNNDKISLQKTVGHVKNSLRKRRSVNETKDVQPAASAPLIVDYETSHGLQPFERRTANIIKSADLANFNIETLHDAQPQKNNDEVQDRSKINDENRSGERDDLNKNYNGRREFDDSSDRDDYKNSERKPQNSEESSENIRLSPSRKDSSDEHHPKGEKENDESYKENLDSREKNTKEPYRENNDSLEQNSRAPYIDDSKEQDRSRESIPHDSREQEYYNNRKSPYRKDHNDERPDSRESSSDSSGEDNRQNSPYKRDESDERDQRQNSRERSSDNSSENNIQNSPYRRDESNERDRSRERDSGNKNDSYKNKDDGTRHDDSRERNKYEQSQEKKDYRTRDDSQSQEKDDSREIRTKYKEQPKFQKAPFKAPYIAPTQDSNEGREQIDNAPYPRQDSVENFFNGDDDKSDYTKPRYEKASISREKAESNENNSGYRDELPKTHVSNQGQFYGNIVQPSLQQPPKPSESGEQEAIITFLKKKNFRKPVINDFKAKSAPIPIKDVDLDDFTYERINVNEKGVVEPVKENYENYEKLPIIDVPLVEPFSTFQPIVVGEDVEQVPKYGIKKEKRIPTRSHLQAKSIPIDDFTYKRNNENDRGLVEPVRNTNERYEKLPIIDVPLIEPVSTFKPLFAKDNNEELAGQSSDVEVNSGSSEESNRSVPIDDVEELKPVVEINPEPEQEENSREALKEQPNGDTSLESLLGIKSLDSDSDEKSDKIVAQQEEINKGDVKQQFERIPLNYNHDKKQQQNDQKSEETPADAPQASGKGKANHNEGTLDILTPPGQDPRFDEHLNFKFDDVTIKLPEIKLPDDILAIPYDSDDYKKSPYNSDDYKKSPYEEKEKKKKSKYKGVKKPFYHYNEKDYQEEDPHKHNERKDNADDDRNHHKHSGEHDDEHEHSYHDYYGQNKKKDDYKRKHDHDDEEEEEDLYEKFVRERFGKRGSFEKRAEKLETRPNLENENLFNTLQTVLQKTKNIEKEAQKSGDPNAGYMWTLEYGQNLN